MRKYVYVIVRSDGTSLALNGADNATDLAALLEEGWEPVRERPMGGSSQDAACSLVLLMRGDDDY